MLGHGINDLSLLGGRCRPQAAVLQACVHPPCSTVPKSRNPSLRVATWLVADARAGRAEEAGGWSRGERLRAWAVGRRSAVGREWAAAEARAGFGACGAAGCSGRGARGSYGGAWGHRAHQQRAAGANRLRSQAADGIDCLAYAPGIVYVSTSTCAATRRRKMLDKTKFPPKFMAIFSKLQLSNVGNPGASA